MRGLLALTIILVYGLLMPYGPAGDDWVHASQYRQETTAMSIAHALNPEGKLFYRPLGELYCLAAYHWFTPVLAHSMAMLTLFLSALLVRSIAIGLTRDPWVGWGSAFLFASAASVHLDSQMWIVGIYDNGLTLFALLGTFLILRKRYILGVGSFLIALGFKGFSQNLFALPLDHPYAARWGVHMLTNLCQYLQWMILP